MCTCVAFLSLICNFVGAESIIWKQSEQDLRQKNNFLYALKYKRTCLKTGDTNTCRNVSAGLADVTGIITACTRVFINYT